MILVENHLHICKNHSQNLRGDIKTIHDGHKDYKCGSCEKSFTGATSLRIHIKKIHEYHKDFKCKYCRKSLKLVIWEYIWKTFMKIKKISNGTLVEHYFLILITWKYTSKPVLKSGYPDYPKSGYIRTIWPTENRCPKSGYPNTLFLEYFHHFSLHFYQYVPHHFHYFPQEFIGNFFVW